jgi:hypothetical protein
VTGTDGCRAGLHRPHVVDAYSCSLNIIGLNVHLFLFQLFIDVFYFFIRFLSFYDNETVSNLNVAIVWQFGDGPHYYYLGSEIRDKQAHDPSMPRLPLAVTVTLQVGRGTSS